MILGGDTPHPSTTAPTGCTFRELIFTGPDVAGLEKLRAALGLDVRVVKGEKAAITLKLDCPKGPVVFGMP